VIFPGSREEARGVKKSCPIKGISNKDGSTLPDIRTVPKNKK
jgi:hypothetical protein